MIGPLLQGSDKAWTPADYVRRAQRKWARWRRSISRQHFIVSLSELHVRACSLNWSLPATRPTYNDRNSYYSHI